MSDRDETSSSQRKASNNRLVDRGNRHTIRGTNLTGLEVVDQYVKRRESPDMYTPKLRYWKNKKGEYRVGFPAEFTLSHDEAVELHRILSQGIAIASEEAGEYLTIRMADGSNVSTEEHSAASIARAIAPLLASRGVLAALSDLPDARSLVTGVEVAARVVELESAIEELTVMLSDQVAEEDEYQRWCEEHSWAFGTVYVARDDVRTIAIGDNVDILVERTANGLRDIFELKRPDMSVIHYDGSHKCYHWSADVSRALGQCHRYLDALHEGAARGLRDNPQVRAYHPRATVVIGRSADWDQEKSRQLHGLNSRLHGLNVLTYDDLLEQARQMIRVLRNRAELQA